MSENKTFNDTVGKHDREGVDTFFRRKGGPHKDRDKDPKTDRRKTRKDLRNEY